MSKMTISTYVLTEVGYGVHPYCRQKFISTVSDSKHNGPIPLTKEIKDFELVDEVKINVADWIGKKIVGKYFNIGSLLSLWADISPYSVAIMLEIDNETPLRGYSFPEDMDCKEVEEDLTEFGEILIRLWKRLPEINKEEVFEKRDNNYDCLDDDTHMGSFFGIENRD